MNFEQKCYLILKKVPKGRITTYKEIAKALGTNAYRVVGNAMNKNRDKNIPCHRVVRSDGSVGGFVQGTNKKIKMLRKEGIGIQNEKIVNFEKILYKFKLS